MLTDIFLKNNEQDDRKKITVFVDPVIHKDAAIKLAQLGGKPAGFSFQSVLEQLLAEWAGGKREVAAQPDKGAHDRYSEDLERLVRVLEGGTPEDRIMVRRMIKNCAEALAQPVKAMPPNPSRSSSSPKKSAHPAR
jgi:hypothetical protein